MRGNRSYTENLDIIQDGFDEKQLLRILRKALFYAYQVLDRYLFRGCYTLPKTLQEHPEILDEMVERREDLLRAFGEIDILRDLLFDDVEVKGKIAVSQTKQAQKWADELLALEGKSDKEVIESFVGEGHLRNGMLDEEFVRDILESEEENTNG